MSAAPVIATHGLSKDYGSGRGLFDLELEFGTPVSPEEFRPLPGVTEVAENGRTLTVAFEGAADSVVKTAARHHVLAVRPRQEDLEDIFLRYYRDEDRP